MDLLAVLRSVLQMLLFVAISPGVVGMLRKVKARLQGRAGPAIYQPYLDLWKLFHKQPVIPEMASWVFVAAPVIIFACYSFIGLIIPVVYLPSRAEIYSDGVPLGDLLVIIYVLGLTHFLMGLASMDTGSPFGGMGGSREMFLNVISEPALILSTYALAISAHTTSLPIILDYYAKLDPTSFISNPSFWLVLVALVLVTMTEAGRIPIDNPSTHLELTMIGKAITLEYSGQLLALLEWAEAMRLTFFLTLIFNLLMPSSLASADRGIWTNLLMVGLYPVRLGGIVLALAVWEATRVKMRLRAVVNPGAVALALSILAIFVTVAINYFV